MLKQLKQDIKKYNLKPNKLMGQNFLICDEVFGKIADALDLNNDDTVLEIGSGLGQMTFMLASKTNKVIAVEKDKELAKILKDKVNQAGINNIEVVNEDILKFDFLKKLKRGCKITGNIPYYLTNFLIRRILEASTPNKINPEIIIFMVQKEVAQRICAKPPKMSILSCAVQFFSAVKLIKIVSKDCFWPRPKVDSAVLAIKPKSEYKEVDNVDLFFKIVKSGFKHPRKQILNNLGALEGGRGYWKKILDSCKIKSDLRPGNLSLNDWIKIYGAIQKDAGFFKDK